ncbi:MAG: hydroxyacid dehydrogenase [Alphaproteobacteria bacterium]|nr:hydroxyacid dehydrogenase [Alphaproteobacteria bacterium]
MRILLTHPPAARANYYGDAALAQLSKFGDVVLNESAGPLGRAALLAKAKGCQIVVSDRQTGADAEFFDSAPDLVAFLRCAMDIRNIDVAAADRAGVLVTRATAGFIDAVVELGFGMLVDLARGTSAAVADYRAGRKPAVRMGIQLSGATLGIVGLGAIGRRLARLTLAAGMDVAFWDPAPRDVPAGAREMPFDEVLARSRFVVCLAPADESTRDLFDSRAFAAMRPGAYFINLARGELVDEAALAAALDSGHLAGAAMDVGRAPDQMPSLALAGRADVVATPHIGGLTPEAVQHQAFDTVRQVEALCAGRMPDNTVNAAMATRLSRLGLRVA